jgi:hypothetical protein
MNAEVIDLSATLRDELAANQNATIDPRSVRVRFSALKQMGLSPAHYLHAVQYEMEQTLAMRLGSGAHAILFDQPVVLWDQPAKKGSGKAPRNGAAWDEFAAKHDGALILNAAEMAEARSMADAIRRHPIAAPLLLDGQTCEQLIEWSFGDRACRSTPDARGPRGLVDVKTTRCAEPGRFSRDGMFRSYHAQLAYYGEAIRRGLGEDAGPVHIVAVESKAPYVVQVFSVSDRQLEQGAKAWRLWFEQVLTCEAAGVWPGYSSTIVPFEAPELDDVSLIVDGEDIAL